jgi:tetraacyldisaccharide 4'-kinase
MKKPWSPRRLLLPLTPLYRLALAWREFLLAIGLEPVRRLRFPVIAIGNLSAGGAGKTPLTIALARALAERGLRVDVLSRGYGRESKLAARVNPAGTAEEFGDEPILIALAARVPVYVAPRRFDAGQLAEADAKAEAAKPAPKPEQAGQSSNPTGNAPPAQAAPDAAAGKAAPDGLAAAADKPTAPPLLPTPVHLLDDGFQHRQLTRNVDILLLDGEDWQDWLLPAGNLREPLQAIHRASAIAVPADEPELETELSLCGWQGPILRLRRKMEIPFAASPIAAFCGIARPEQFFKGLESAGLKITVRFAFPDHYAYTRAVLDELLAEARENNVTAIVTTGKDLVRLGKLASLFPNSMPLVTAHLHIQIEDLDSVVDWLIDQVTNAPHG